MPNSKSFVARFFLPAVLPLGITAFYTVPASISYIRITDSSSLTVLLLSLLCTITYLFIWISKTDLTLLKFVYSLDKRAVELNSLALWISTGYFLLMTYAAYTAPSIPLFDAARGLDIDSIASSRETFLRTRVGLEVSLNYIYSMSRSFLMPFAVCVLYHGNSKFRHIILMLFMFSLMLTLEKSLSILALLPIFYLFASARNYKMAAIIILLTVASISLTSFLARGGATHFTVVESTAPILPTAAHSEPEHEIQTHTVNISIQEPAISAPQPDIVVAGASTAPSSPPQSMATIPEKYNMFSGSSQLEYVLNRIFYIPYATANDWIRYQEEKMSGGYTYGRSISIIAFLFNEQKINLERNVFSFQWGQNETGTGSSNTAYFIDAYLNFGLIGCIIYTLIIVCILRLTIMSKIATLQACIFVPTIFLLFNSLTAMIFSGGLFALITLALFFSEKERHTAVAV